MINPDAFRNTSEESYIHSGESKLFIAGTTLAKQTRIQQSGDKMAVAERIQKYVLQLPARMQSEVLNFVEHLLVKAAREDSVDDEQSWSDISLTFAMRNMENEETPEYSLSDLKESF